MENLEKIYRRLNRRIFHNERMEQEDYDYFYRLLSEEIVNLERYGFKIDKKNGVTCNPSMIKNMYLWETKIKQEE